MYKKKIFFVLTIFAVLALALSVFGCSVVENAQEFYASGDEFLTALKDGDYAGAYALFHTSLQQEVGSAENLKAMVEDNQAQPSEWSYTSFNLSTDEDGIQTATVEGKLIYQDGREGIVELEMVKVDDDWQLFSFNLTW